METTAALPRAVRAERQLSFGVAVRALTIAHNVAPLSNLPLERRIQFVEQRHSGRRIAAGGAGAEAHFAARQQSIGATEIAHIRG